MSTTIDQEVVQMRFDNRQFEAGVAQTLQSLKNLKENLNFSGAVKGLTSIENVSRSVTLGAVSNAVETVQMKFNALDVMAATALANMTTNAINTGKRIVSALTIQLPKEGFGLYEQKINSIQTIVTNTGESLDTVNGILAELNEYSNKTIYKFSDMTSSLSKFTAAGIKLDVASKAIQGISNAAAAAGASTADAGRAMYNISQAYGVGSMKLIDWKSIENANMATKELKQTMIDAGVEVGTLIKGEDNLVRTNKGTIVTWKTMRETLNENWLTTEAMNKAFEWYSNETIEIGKAAASAAKDVKTLTQFFDTLKESISTGWSDSFELVLGNFEEAKEVLTNVSQIITGFMDLTAAHRNDILWDWKQLGGRKALINGIYNAFSAVYRVIHSIKLAINDIFPALTGATLVSITNRFEAFTKKLIASDQTLEDLRDTIGGIMSILDLVRIALLSVIQSMFPMIDSFHTLLLVILRLTAALGRILKTWSKNIKETKLLENVIKGVLKTLSSVVAIIISLIALLAVGIVKIVEFVASILQMEVIGSVFKGIATVISTVVGVIIYGFASVAKVIASFVRQVNSLRQAGVPVILAAIDAALSGVTKGFDKLANTFLNIYEYIISRDFIQVWFTNLLDSIKNLVKFVGNAIRNNPITVALDQIKMGASNAGISLAWFSETLGKFLTKLTPAKVLTFALAASLISLSFVFSGLVGQIMDLVKAQTRFINQITSVIAMKFVKQDTAKIIQSIAIAIGALGAAMYLIGKLDTKDVIEAGAALVVLLGEIGAIAYMLAKATSKLSETSIESASVWIQTSSIILSLASAVGILALSFRLMNDVDFTDFWAKIGAIGLIASEIALVAGLLSKFVPQLTKGSIFLLVFSISVSKIMESLLMLKDVNAHRLDKTSTSLLKLMAGVSLLAIAASKMNIASPLALLGVIVLVKQFLPSLLELAAENSESIGKVITFIDKNIEAIGVIATLAMMMTAVSGLLGKKINSFTKGLFRVTAAVVALLGVALYISKLEEQNVDMNAGLVAIESVMAMMVAIELASVFTKESNIVSFGTCMLLLSGALGMMLMVVHAAGDLVQSSPTIWAGYGVVAALTGLIVAIEAMSTWTKGSSLGGVIGIMASYLVLLGEMIILSDEIESNGPAIEQSMITMVHLMVAFAGVLGATALVSRGIKNFKGTVGVVIAAALSITSLVAALVILASQPTDNLDAVLLTLAGVIGAFGLVLNKMQGLNVSIGHLGNNKVIRNNLDGKNGLWACIVSLCAGLSAISLSLSVLAKNDWGSILASAGAIVMVLGALTGILTVFNKMQSIFDSKNTLIASGAIAVMSAALIGIAVAFNSFGMANWDVINENLITILDAVLISVAIAEALALVGEAASTGMALGIAMLGALSVYVNALAFALNLMVEPVKQLDPARIAGIAGALALMGLAGYVVITSAAGFSILGYGLIIIAKAAEIANSVFANFVPVMEKFVEIVSGVRFWKVISNSIAIALAMSLMAIPLRLLLSSLNYGILILSKLGGFIVDLSNGINVLSFALMNLSKIGKEGTENLERFFNMIFKNCLKIGLSIIPIFNALLISLGLNIPGVMGLSTVIVALGIAFTAAGYGIRVMSDAIIAFGQTSLPELDTNLEILAESIPKIAEACAQLTVAITPLSEPVLKFAAAILEAGTGLLLAGLGMGLVAMAAVGASIGFLALGYALSTFVDTLNSLGGDFGNRNFKALCDVLRELALVGMSLIPGMTGLIGAAAGVWLLVKAFEGLKDISKYVDSLTMFNALLKNLSQTGLMFVLGSIGLAAGAGSIYLLTKALENLQTSGVAPSLSNAAQGILELAEAGKQMILGAIGILAGAVALQYLSGNLDLTPAITTAGTQAYSLGVALIYGIISGITGNSGILQNALTSLGSMVVEWFNSGTHGGGSGRSHAGLAGGGSGAYHGAGGKSIEAAAAAIPERAANSVKHHAPALKKAGGDLGEDLVEGVEDELEDSDVGESFVDGCKGLWDEATKAFDVFQSTDGTIKDKINAGIGEIAGSLDNGGGVLTTVIGKVADAVGLNLNTTFSSVLDDFNGNMDALYKSQVYWLDTFDATGKTKITEANDPEMYAKLEEAQRWLAEEKDDGSSSYRMQKLYYTKLTNRYSRSETKGLFSDYDELLTSMEDIGDVASAGSESLSEFEKYLQNLEQSIDEAGTSFGKFEVDFSTKSKDLLKNAERNIMGVSSWGTDMQIAAQKGISAPILKELSELGPEGYDKLHAFLEMSEEEIEEYNNLYTESIENNKTSLIKTMAALATAGDEDAIQYIKDAGLSLEELNSELDETAGYIFQTEQKFDDLSESIKESIQQFEAFDFTAETTGKELTSNLKSQFNGISQWSLDFMQLARKGLSTEVLKSLEELGTDGYDKVRAFMQMSEEEIEEYNELYSKRLELSNDSAVSIMASYALAGDEAAKAFIDAQTDVDLDKLDDSLGTITDKYFKVRDAAISVQETFTSLKETISNQISIFDEFNETTEITGDQMISNMESQIEGITKWSENLNSLAQRGISSELLKSLSELGPNGYAKVAAFVDMTDDQLMEANELYSKSLSLPESATGEILSSYAKAGDETVKTFCDAIGSNYNDVVSSGQTIVEAMKTLGTQINEGLFIGVKEGLGTVKDAGTLLSQTFEDAVREALDTHSPSRIMEDIGGWQNVGFVNGIKSKLSLVKEAAQDMASTFSTSVEDGMNRASNRLSNGFNLSPRITPVFDNSRAVQGAQSLSSLISANQAAKYASQTQQANANARMYEYMGNQYAAMAKSISNAKVPVNVNVVLEGDAKGVFNMVRTENQSFTQSTGWNPLANPV